MAAIGQEWTFGSKTNIPFLTGYPTVYRDAYTGVRANYYDANSAAKLEAIIGTYENSAGPN